MYNIFLDKMHSDRCESACMRFDDDKSKQTKLNEANRNNKRDLKVGCEYRNFE